MSMIMLGQICNYNLMDRTTEARMLKSLVGIRKVAKKKWKLTMSKLK